jgi:phosphoribosylglycinamide formyltransferase-1
LYRFLFCILSKKLISFNVWTMRVQHIKMKAGIMDSRFRVAGLISASGSTAAGIFQACENGTLDATMPLIIASNEAAGSAFSTFSKRPHIAVVPRKMHASAWLFGRTISEIMRGFGIDFVGLYGWDPLIPGNVIKKYQGRMVNQHPDLTPYFGGSGMNGVVAVCARLYFNKLVGRPTPVEPVAHWVTDELDGGDVVQKGQVHPHPGDTCESLYKRVKVEELRVQIATVQAAITGTLSAIRVDSPLMRTGEEVLLARAKKEALEHHSGQSQSQVKK